MTSARLERLIALKKIRLDEALGECARSAGLAMRRRVALARIKHAASSTATGPGKFLAGTLAATLEIQNRIASATLAAEAQCESAEMARREVASAHAAARKALVLAEEIRSALERKNELRREVAAGSTARARGGKL